jgi:hypothetical protein
VSAKYNRIGDGYDATRRADSAIMQALADYLNLQKHGRYHQFSALGAFTP